MAKESIKLIANNKKARHDYFLEEKYEAGIHFTAQKSNPCVWENAASKSLLSVLRTERSLSMACISLLMKKEIFLIKDPLLPEKTSDAQSGDP